MKRYYTILYVLLLIINSSCNKNLELDSKYDNSKSSILPSLDEDHSSNNLKDFGFFTMSEIINVNQPGIDMQGFWPDGKLSVFKNDNAQFIIFWGEKYSIRTEGESPYPENQILQVLPVNRVFGKGIQEQQGFNDGGSWFIGVHKLEDQRLVGFFHAESHWTGGMAYKSIGVTYSTDKGRTWSAGRKILNVDYPKPTEAKWSGLGDGCVVYNQVLGKFICYYSAYVAKEDYKIAMAASRDSTGIEGSWKKWDGNDFAVDGLDAVSGLGGIDHKVQGLSSRSGANPSVMWNSYLKKWLMVYSGWDKVIYMSVSTDGLAWEEPFALTLPDKETATYPNLIGENGDLEGGKVIKLYYGRNQDQNGIREFSYRILTLK